MTRRGLAAAAILVVLGLTPGAVGLARVRVVAGVFSRAGEVLAGIPGVAEQLREGSAD